MYSLLDLKPYRADNWLPLYLQKWKQAGMMQF